MWRLASSLLVLTLFACSDDDGMGPADAAPSDGAFDSMMADPGAPAPPEIDWLDDLAPAVAPAASPQMTPCAAGWREVDVDGVTACDPYPSSGVGACADHEAHFPGASACERIGTSCAADGWPAGLPAADVAYVRPGASGTGTRASPFGRISDALASGAATVALAEGSYGEAVDLSAGVALVGACAEATILTRAVTIGGDAARLTNLSVTGNGISSSATASIEDVVVDGASGVGISVTSGELTLSRVAIRDVTGVGRGVAVAAGASALLDRAAIEGGSGDAVYASGSGARIELVDTAVRDAGGYGLLTSAGASARVERGVIVGSARANVSNASGTVELVDVVLRGDGTAPTGREKQGIVQSDGSLTLSRVLLADSGFAGIDLWAGDLEATDLVVHGSVPAPGLARSGYGIIASAGSITLERAHLGRNTTCGIASNLDSARLTDVTVAGTRESEPTMEGFSFGCGVQVTAREATLTRIRTRDTVRFGVAILGEETEATLSDVYVSDTVGSMADGEGGQGLFVFQGATATAERVVVERSEFAAFAANDGSSLTVTDIVARDVTSPNNFGISGYGIRCEDGSVMNVTRALIEQIDLAGIHVVDDGSSITASDVVVRDMRGEQHFGLHGWALGVTNGGQADLTRVYFSRSRYVGIVTNGVGSHLTAVDLVLEDTLEARCADELCADAPFGIGLGTYSGSAVDLRRFRITRSHVIGVQLAGEGMVDLAEGEVSMSPIGANIQTDPFALERLTERVFYRENEQNLVTEALPVPTFGGL